MFIPCHNSHVHDYKVGKVQSNGKLSKYLQPCNCSKGKLTTSDNYNFLQIKPDGKCETVAWPTKTCHQKVLTRKMAQDISTDLVQYNICEGIGRCESCLNANGVYAKQNCSFQKLNDSKKTDVKNRYNISKKKLCSVPPIKKICVEISDVASTVLPISKKIAYIRNSSINIFASGRRLVENIIYDSPNNNTNGKKNKKVQCGSFAKRTHVHKLKKAPCGTLVASLALAAVISTLGSMAAASKSKGNNNLCSSHYSIWGNAI